jgi:WD40 repeat protein
MWLGLYDGSISCWDLSKLTNIFDKKIHTEATLDLIFEPVKKKIWTSGKDKMLTVFSTRKKEISKRIPVGNGKTISVANSIIVVGDNIWGACEDGIGRGNKNLKIKNYLLFFLVWDCKKYKLKREFIIAMNRPLKQFLKVNNDILAASDSVIYVIDPSNGAVRQSVPGHIGMVTSMCHVPSSGTLWTVGVDKTVKVWSISKEYLLVSDMPLSAKAATVINIPLSGHVFVGCFSSQTFFWDAKSWELVQFVTDGQTSVATGVVDKEVA